MNIVSAYLLIITFVIGLSLISEVWRWYSVNHLGLHDDLFEIFKEEDV